VIIYTLLRFQSNLYVKLLWYLLPNDNMPAQLESTITALLIQSLHKYLFFFHHYLNYPYSFSPTFLLFLRKRNTRSHLYPKIFRKKKHDEIKKKTNALFKRVVFFFFCVMWVPVSKLCSGGKCRHLIMNKDKKGRKKKKKRRIFFFEKSRE
jgi:hypothetical protein